MDAYGTFPELEGLTPEQRVAELQRQAAEDYARHQERLRERLGVRSSLRGKDN